MLWVLKSRESQGRLSYYHTFLLLWVLKSRETGGCLNYYTIVFKYFWYSSQENVEDVTAIIILFLLLWVLTSRESEVRLSSYHTFSDALGTQVKRK